MNLEVLISTYGQEGIARTARMKLPEVKGVSYLVSLQLPETVEFEVPDSLRRDDLRIVVSRSRGLSRNRNNALDHSSGDILLIADDDLDFTAEALESVKSTFEENPLLDFATFRHMGKDEKWFPSHEFDFGEKEPSGYYLTSFELAVKRQSIVPCFRFPENMGAGTPVFGSGEENVFLLQMLNGGLRGKFFPITVTVHNGLTTGCRRATPATLRGQGAYFRLRYGSMEGILRLLRDAPRRNYPLLPSIVHMLAGYLRASEVWKG